MAAPPQGSQFHTVSLTKEREVAPQMHRSHCVSRIKVADAPMILKQPRSACGASAPLVVCFTTARSIRYVKINFVKIEKVMQISCASLSIQL